jgi:methyl-accepting chemotaxis protein
MSRIRFGLRAKLIVAFLCISLFPLSVVMALAIVHGGRLEQANQELLQNTTSVEDEFVATLNAARASTIARLEQFQHTPPTSAEAASLATDFEAHWEQLAAAQAGIRDLNAAHAAFVEGYFQNRQASYTIMLIAIALGSAGLAFWWGASLTRPVLQLADVAGRMAQGDFETPVRIGAKDELKVLSDAFIDVSAYVQDMAVVATRIANGNLSQMRPPSSARDVLGNAFHAMEQYLRTISDVAGQIADGNLTYAIQAQSDDDVLGTAFAQMRAHLTGLLRQVKEEVRIIEEASEDTARRSQQDLKMVEDVLSSAEETSSSMMEMQASVEEVSSNMKALAGAIEETVSSIEQMTVAIKQVGSNSAGLANSAEETFIAIQEIGRAVERLVDTSHQAETSSREASESAHAGQVSVREIIEGMDVISHAVATAGEMIKTLDSRSEEIGSITNVITDIADQTSLLALNASIIAAQAGDHGRGFAVVAHEVKELANRSSNAAKEIEGLIKSVQAESQKAVASMEQGRKAVETGVKLANRGGEALNAILSSVERTLASIAENTNTAHEQARLSEQVRAYMENVVAMVNEIVRATNEQQQGAAQITQAVGNMRNLSEQVNRATTEQTRGTNHVLEAMDNVTMRVQESSNRAQELARYSADLAHETHTLMQLLQQFQIGEPERAIAPTAAARPARAAA